MKITIINKRVFYTLKLFIFCLFIVIIGPTCDPENVFNQENNFDIYFEVTPESGDVGTIFTFDASSTKKKEDPNSGASYPCRWDFNDDGTFEIIDKYTQNIVTYQYKEPGIYRVKLEVSLNGFEYDDFYIRSIAVTGGSNETCYDDYHSICIDEPKVNIGGRDYKTVQIGNQCWMAENLDIGDMILNTDEAPKNDNKIQKLCYDNDPENCKKYGGLYNWYETMNYSNESRTQGICPDGWHIPTQSDWDELANTLDKQVAGRKMMSCENNPWGDEDLNNNESGFTAFPSGRHSIYYDWVENESSFWTSDEDNSQSLNYVYIRTLHKEVDELISHETNSGNSYATSLQKYDAVCIRCIRN